MGGLGSPRTLRTVIHSLLFDQQLVEIEPNAARAEEQVQGVEWALARRAETFALSPGSPVGVIRTNAEPHLRIFFTIDDANTCTLQWIETVSDFLEEDHT